MSRHPVTVCRKVTISRPSRQVTTSLSWSLWSHGESSSRHGGALRLCVFLSVLLHGLILLRPGFTDRAPDDGLDRAPIRASIRMLPRAHPVGESSVVANTVRPASDPVSRDAITVPAKRTKDDRQITIGPLAKERAVEPVMEVPSPPAINLEDVRAQARGLAVEAPPELVRGTRARRNPPENAVPDLLDRPVLEVLSKRIGRPLVVASEQLMNDGSWMIRFSDNICLHIPRHLSLGADGGVVPTMLVPTTCSGS